MGYNVALEGDKIKLRFTGEDDPPKEASAMIQAIKENKAIVIEYLQNTCRMDEIFKQAVGEISGAFMVNAINFTQKMFSETYKKGIAAEDKINRLWDEGKDIKAFSEAVKEWQELHKGFIKLLKAKKGVEAVMGTGYNSPNGKPDPRQGLGKEVV